MNFSDKVIAAMVAANGVAAGVREAIIKIEPILSPLISIGQFGIAVVTIIWILVRVRGARLDNKLKEKELNK